MRLNHALPELVLLQTGVSAMAAEDFSLTVFANQSTRNYWKDFFISPGSLNFASSGLLAAALSKPLARYRGGDLTVEIEGQVVKHLVETREGSQPWLIHWFMELTLGPPGKDWSASLGLHHGSTSFGLTADKGGLAPLAIGVRKCC